jgi:hypothetical protein
VMHTSDGKNRGFPSDSRVGREDMSGRVIPSEGQDPWHPIAKRTLPAAFNAITINSYRLMKIKSLTVYFCLFLNLKTAK